MPHRDTSEAYQSSYYLGSKCHKGTQVKLINQAITQTLNATQGHKRSFKTSYYFASKCHTGSQAWAIYQTLNQSFPYTEVCSQSEYSMGEQLLYTVIKAEFWIQQKS